jgi:hypothetical protein
LNEIRNFKNERQALKRRIMPTHNGREITDRKEATEIMLELLAKKYRNREARSKHYEELEKKSSEQREAKKEDSEK